MWLVLLFLIGLVLVNQTHFRQRQNLTKHKEKHNLQTATGIKYDKREVKGYFIATIFTLIVMLLALGAILLDVSVSSVIQATIIYAFLTGGILVFLFSYHLLDGILYLKRLKGYGYEVPEDKRKYDGLLELLPKKEGQLPREKKTSKFLMCMSILACLVMVGLSLRFWHNRHFMGDETTFLFVVLLIVDLLWLVPVVCFAKQGNTQKYKDDVEIDANRKDRMNFFRGAFEIIILIAVGLVVKNTAYNMSEYVFQSWMVKDGERIMEIGQAVENTSIDPDVKEDHENYEEIMRSMEEGVDITNWGVPQGRFQEELAQTLGITDFSRLKDAFYCADGPAIVYVKLEEGQVTVQLANVYPAAEWEVKYE